jgi:hypothetical protein
VRAELVDSCRVDFAEERDLPQTNWVLADYINLKFSNSNLDEFIAERGVSYYYEQEATGRRDYFLNEARGQYLEAKFGQDNKLEHIRMRHSINGVYKFRSKS